MSVADLITSITTACDGRRLQHSGGALCELAAVLVWYGAWASWMWMGGYAFALYHCLHGAFAVQTNATPVGLYVRPLSWRINLALHCLCWGVPLLMVIAVYLMPDATFGPSADHGDGAAVCTLTVTSQGAGVALTALLWVVMAYGAFVFIAVQWRLCSSVAAATDVVRPAERRAAYRRITMWPQFLAYIMVFLISQGPGVVISNTDNVAYPDWVQAMVAAFGNLHGMLNAVTYGLTNAEVYVNWLPSGKLHPARASQHSPLCSPFASDSGLPTVLNMPPPSQTRQIHAAPECTYGRVVEGTTSATAN